MEGARGRGWGPSSWLWGGLGVALVWLWCGLGVALVWPWCGFVLRSLCLVYAQYMALWWLWVALRGLWAWLSSVLDIPSCAETAHLRSRAGHGEDVEGTWWGHGGDTVGARTDRKST